MTILPGAYTPTRPGWKSRIVTSVTETSVTFHHADEPERTITVQPETFGVWVYISQAIPSAG